MNFSRITRALAPAGLAAAIGDPPTTTERISLEEYTVGVGYTARF